MPYYLILKKNKKKFFGKIKNFKKLYFFLTIYRYSEIIGDTHLLPLHNEPSPPMPVGRKLWEGLHTPSTLRYIDLLVCNHCL